MKGLIYSLILISLSLNSYSQYNYHIPIDKNLKLNFNNEPPIVDSFNSYRVNTFHRDGIIYSTNHSLLYQYINTNGVNFDFLDSIYSENQILEGENDFQSVNFSESIIKVESEYYNAFNYKLDKDSENTSIIIKFNKDNLFEIFEINELLKKNNIQDEVYYPVLYYKQQNFYLFTLLKNSEIIIFKGPNLESLKMINLYRLIDNNFNIKLSIKDKIILKRVVNNKFYFFSNIYSSFIENNTAYNIISNQIIEYDFIENNFIKKTLNYCNTKDNKQSHLYNLLEFSSDFKYIYGRVFSNSKHLMVAFHSLDTFNSFIETQYEIGKDFLENMGVPVFINSLPNGKIAIIDNQNKFHYVFRPDSGIFNGNILKEHNFFTNNGNLINFYFARSDLYFQPYGNFPKFKPLHKICVGVGGKIPNLSDTFEYEKFVWYLSDNDSLEGYEVQPAYSEPGKYLLKLKAYSKYGYFSWFSDSVIVTENPAPSFTTQVDTGCQFVAFDFENTTDYRGFEPEEVEMLWDFGDGQTSTEINPKHTYKKSGNYTVKLTTSIENGCKSTFEYPLSIVIKPAPEPKLILSDTVGCSPLTVSYSQAVNEEYLSIKNVVNGDTLAIEQGVVTYYEPGEYEITQIVEAENGCLPTKTKKITVYRGISSTETVKNLYASYTDSGVLVRWGALQGAAGYRLQYADKDLVTTDLEFLHKTTNQYVYNITAIDSCGNMSQTVKISPINLTGSTDPQNFAANLSWSNYPTPDYCVERLSLDSSWENLGCVNSLNFSDEEFAEDESFAERCYRVRSVTEPKSYSNVVCLPFVAQLWIPNAFSPNTDGINDVWQLRGIGIKEIKVSVYNRWGQLVYEADRLTDSWDGVNAQEGVYLYIVQYQENSGRKRLEKGVLRVVR
jgi:gliding motility-associated-like protein